MERMPPPLQDDASDDERFDRVRKIVHDYCKSNLKKFFPDMMDQSLDLLSSGFVGFYGFDEDKINDFFEQLPIRLEALANSNRTPETFIKPLVYHAIWPLVFENIDIDSETVPLLYEQVFDYSLQNSMSYRTLLLCLKRYREKNLADQIPFEDLSAIIENTSVFNYRDRLNNIFYLLGKFDSMDRYRIMLCSKLGFRWAVAMEEHGVEYSDLVNLYGEDLINKLRKISPLPEDYQDYSWRQKHQFLYDLAVETFGMQDNNVKPFDTRALRWLVAQRAQRGVNALKAYNSLNQKDRQVYRSEAPFLYEQEIENSLLMPRDFRDQVMPCIDTTVGVEVEFEAREKFNFATKLILNLASVAGIKEGLDFPEISPGPYNNVYDLIDFLRKLHDSGLIDPKKYGYSIHYNLGYISGMFIYDMYLLTTLSGYSSIPGSNPKGQLKYFVKTSNGVNYVENKQMAFYGEPSLYRLIEQTYWIAVSMNSLSDYMGWKLNDDGGFYADQSEVNTSVAEILEYFKYDNSYRSDTPYMAAKLATSYLVLMKEGLREWGFEALPDMVSGYYKPQGDELAELLKVLRRVQPNRDAILRNDAPNIVSDPKMIDGMMFNNVVHFVQWLMESWARDVINLHLENQF